MDDPNVTSSLALARVIAALAFILWIIAIVRIRRHSWLFGGVILWACYLWGINNLPLNRIYALDVGNDRLNNLAMSIPVAAGTPFYETHQVGQLNFEPFWSLFVALASGWNPDRALSLYPYLSLFILVGFLVSLYMSLLPAKEGASWSGWERALVTYFALMMSTLPLDQEGPYQATWNVVFLLKPNHSLGLVMIPPLVAILARTRTWRGRVAAGLLLHLIGWAFVIYWAVVSVGLLVYVALSWVEQRKIATKAFLDVLVALGVNLVIVSPYLYMLVAGYPFLVPHRHQVLPSLPAHFLQVTLDQGAVFFLAVWGGIVLYRRDDPLSRIWLSIALGGLAAWCGYVVLSWLQFVKETDDVYHLIQVYFAIVAGVGAWNLARRAAPRLGWSRPALAAAVLVVCFPLTLLSWWDPQRMDHYFRGSVPPLREPLVQTTAFIRKETEPGANFIAGRAYSRFVAALGARRVLLGKFIHSPPNSENRRDLERSLLVDGDVEAMKDLAERYHVRYVLVASDLLEDYGVTLDQLERRPHWKEIFSAGEKEKLHVFALENVGSP